MAVCPVSGNLNEVISRMQVRWFAWCY